MLVSVLNVPLVGGWWTPWYTKCLFLCYFSWIVALHDLLFHQSYICNESFMLVIPRYKRGRIALSSYLLAWFIPDFLVYKSISPICLCQVIKVIHGYSFLILTLLGLRFFMEKIYYIDMSLLPQKRSQRISTKVNTTKVIATRWVVLFSSMITALMFEFFSCCKF